MAALGGAGAGSGLSGVDGAAVDEAAWRGRGKKRIAGEVVRPNRYTRHTLFFGLDARLSHPIAALRLLAIELAIARRRALLSGNRLQAIPIAAWEQLTCQGASVIVGVGPMECR